MPRPAAIRAAEALVEISPGGMLAVAGRFFGGPFPNIGTFFLFADVLRRRLVEVQPILAPIAHVIVETPADATEPHIRLAGVLLVGPEPDAEARARHARLVAGLAEAIETAWNEGLKPAAPSPGLDREAGEGAEASLPASGRVDRGKVERALREAGWDAQADDIAEGAALGNVAAEIRSRQCKRSDRALASMLEALAPADVSPGAVGGRDGWDLLQWRDYAEQLEERVAHLERMRERVCGALEEG